MHVARGTNGLEGTAGDARENGGFERNVRLSRLMMAMFGAGTAIYIIVVSLAWTFADFLVLLGFSMFFIGPTYIANAMMVFTSDGRPIDGGRNFVDGKRLFGRTKTIGGFIGGLAFGTGFGLLFGLVFYFNYPAIEEFARGQVQFLALVTLDDIRAFLYPNFAILFARAFFCGLGAPLGDLVGSFLKRRVSIGSGKPFWFVDQLDFIAVTILLNIPWWPMDTPVVVLLLVITPSITLIANNVAYAIGKKREPW